MPWTLAASAAASLAAGALFLHVGVGMRDRAARSAGDRRALRAFATWWASLGGATMLLGALALLGLVDGVLPAVALAVRAASLALSALALWGLLSFLLYVYTGREAWFRRVAWLYGVLIALTLAQMARAGAGGLDVGAWTVEVAPARPPAPWWPAATAAVFLLPAVAASLAFLRLRARTRDRAQRRRILVVGVGVLLWTSTTLLARLSEADLWQLLTRVVLGIVVAAAVHAAYADPALRRARQEALHDRVRDLV